MKKIISVLFVLSLCFNYAYAEADNPDPNTVNLKLQVWNTVKTINYHWAITEDMDSLALYIHNDMIIYAPGNKELSQGKEHIIRLYKAYAESAETLDLKEEEPVIYLYNENKTAVVSYLATLKIMTSNGKVETFQVKDMYTLVYENGRWYAVAQHYSFL